MKKIIAMIAAMIVGLVLSLSAITPAYAYDYIDYAACDGGNSNLVGYIGVDVGADFITQITVQDAGASAPHTWDWWIYRDGESVRHQENWSGTFYYTTLINNTAGPNSLKFRFANNARTINCVAIVYI